MDTARGEGKEANGCENKAIVSLNSSEIEDQISEEEESESQCLLPPRKGGMSRSNDKIKRTVQWNDNKGDNLAEVLVYEPSEVSDTEDDDSDSCICTIM
ncbi:unnamed protein product [Arabidopsis lyrata]|uniref:Uncharacterized protein n=1 Tax=Arabidopsis lyrata subsp. lyrata TaxID=81972 RepID=D7LG99_ARALL|nr:uncharacterized protein LOC9317349 [Arabidopsis lyrata subsp. lyrata]EFH55707.1 hypothetical protein ARALYDRAFT_482282 [Arabidopsis lyrata subsp. lyrata]CAH8264599.1 unnamed protein product [Arabidopsis lyrata]|eukprot:XP_002879448.1 uncharacterized protein LOC9317349 [Arabidopsis lyrata subsp. lyrata]